MNTYEMLSRDNFVTINKIVARKIGITATALLSELCYRRQYLEREGKLSEDGFFYATVQSIEEQLPISEYEQKKILSNLQEMGIVVVERRGLPAKRHIYIDEGALSQLLTTTQDFSEQVPEDLGNKSLKDSGCINNNINNNNSSSSISKDILLSRASSRRSVASTANSSGKLFSAEKPKTRKSSVQKINTFISMCQREAIKKEFSQEVLSVLDEYFRMLAEMNCLLPSVSISEQLSWLKKVSDDKQTSVVKNTVSRGWRSLQYEAEATISSRGSSKDTSDPDAFKAKTEEEKSYNWREEVPPDHIF